MLLLHDLLGSFTLIDINLRVHWVPILQAFNAQPSFHDHQTQTKGVNGLDAEPPARALDSLSSFLQAAILDELKRGKTALMTLVLRVKGHQKMLLLQDLLGSYTLDDINLRIRTLQSIGCPSLKRLMPSQS